MVHTGRMNTSDDPRDLVRALAAEIRAERARQHLTQAAVYEKAGISKSAYLKIENARLAPKMSALEDICTVLDIRLSELFQRAEAQLSR